MVAIIVTLFVALPMAVPYLRHRISYEWRKLMHYLCFVWAAALMLHAPQRIFWFIGVPVAIYITDKLTEILFKTHLIESAYFERLGMTSCIVSFENPPGFGKQNSAYVYIMLPWLSKYQFHAFTVFPCTKPNHSSVCIHKCGDWTTMLMEKISTPTHKPAFVIGPYLSPFSSPAMHSENLVAVASGIGVTPAISLIKQYSKTRCRLNLIWICRDPGLIEHFLLNVDFGCDGYILVYNTGKERPLVLGDDIAPNIFIFNSRPNIERAISGIIVSIASGICPTEKLYESEYTIKPTEMRCKLLLQKALSIYTMDQLYDFTVMASKQHHLGFDPLLATVDCQGVMYTMSHLLGDNYHLLIDHISDTFATLDGDGSGRLDRNRFECLINLLLVNDVSNAVHEESTEFVHAGGSQWEICCAMFESRNPDIENSEVENLIDAFSVTKQLQAGGHNHNDKKLVSATRNWKMLYCGGSQPVLEILKDLERRIGIDLAVEKFDW